MKKLIICLALVIGFYSCENHEEINDISPSNDVEISKDLEGVNHDDSVSPELQKALDDYSNQFPQVSLTEKEKVEYHKQVLKSVQSSAGNMSNSVIANTGDCPSGVIETVFIGQTSVTLRTLTGGFVSQILPDTDYRISVTAPASGNNTFFVVPFNEFRFFSVTAGIVSINGYADAYVDIFGLDIFPGGTRTFTVRTNDFGGLISFPLQGGGTLAPSVTCRGDAAQIVFSTN